jgi:hypothetical protein
MAVSATDTPATVIVNQDGQQGAPGVNGIDGTGFNQVRKTLIDNPLCYLFKKNNIVNRLSGTLDIVRAVAGSYTDIYGDSQTGVINTEREEARGWLITSDETDTFAVFDNVPLLDDGFSVVLQIGWYLPGSASQNIVHVPTSAGDLLTIGTNASGNIIATLQGSDATQYTATSTTTATITFIKTIIVTFDGVDLKIYHEAIEIATVTFTPTTTAAMDLAGDVTINGDFTVNMRGLRFYDFVLNSDEIIYLS